MRWPVQRLFRRLELSTRATEYYTVNQNDIQKLRKAAEDADFMRHLLAEPEEAAAGLGIQLPPEAVESLRQAAKDVIYQSSLPDEFELFVIKPVWLGHPSSMPD